MDVRVRLRRAWVAGGNRPLLALIAVLRGAQEHMRGVVWQPFAIGLGLPMKSLGALESVLDLTRISFQPLFGSASDAVGRKRFLVLRELLLLGAMAFLIFAGSWHFLLAGALLIGLSLAIEPVWTSFVAESSGSGGLGSAFGIVNASFMAAGVFAPLSAGLLAEALGYSSVYSLCACLGIVTLLIIRLRVHETNDRVKRDASSHPRLARVLVEPLRPPRRLLGFYLSMAVDGIAFGLGARLLYGMLTRSHGFTPYMLSLITLATTVTWALVQIPVGRVIDRVGYGRSLAISQALSCFYLLAMIVSQRFEVVLAAHILIGFSAALWVPAEQAWISSHVEPEKRGEHLGSFWTFRGLMAFPAPFIGGLIYDSLGFVVPLTVNLAGAMLDVVLIAILVKD